MKVDPFGPPIVEAKEQKCLITSTAGNEALKSPFQIQFNIGCNGQLARNCDSNTTRY